MAFCLLIQLEISPCTRTYPSPRKYQFISIRVTYHLSFVILHYIIIYYVIYYILLLLYTILFYTIIKRVHCLIFPSPGIERWSFHLWCRVYHGGSGLAHLPATALRARFRRPLFRGCNGGPGVEKNLKNDFETPISWDIPRRAIVLSSDIHVSSVG